MWWCSPATVNCSSSISSTPGAAGSQRVMRVMCMSISWRRSTRPNPRPAETGTVVTTGDHATVEVPHRAAPVAVDAEEPHGPAQPRPPSLVLHLALGDDHSSPVRCSGLTQFPNPVS
jgi:hypothetical protein